VVGPGEHRFDRLGIDAGIPENVTQWRACPLRGAHGLDEPRLAERARPQVRPSITRTFHRDPDRPRRFGAQVVKEVR
jgi:hypothetical protein